MVTKCTRGSIQNSHCNCKLDAAIVESVSKFECASLSSDLLQISRIMANVVVIIAALLIFAEVSRKLCPL